ncbi:hypothetical protein BBJ28_00021003 [Nothophytophthora sp. Chile5]|nr:hypothetical protein BBJ28_00021003 [Nothophytophthora sp. Chile5]
MDMITRDNSSIGPERPKSAKVLAINPVGGSSTRQLALAIPSLRQRLLRRRGLALAAARTMVTVIRHGTVCGALACLVNFFFTFGNVFSGKTPSHQSNVEFTTAIVAMTVTLYCNSLFVTSTIAMSSLHRIEQPDKRWGFKVTFTRLLKSMLPFYIVIHAITISVTYLIGSAPRKTAASFKVHIYVVNMINTLYHAGNDEACRTIFRRHTVEGQRIGLAYRNTPYWKRYLRAWARSLPFGLVCVLAAAFIHTCSSITLTTQLALAIFSVVSVAIKSLVLAFTKYLTVQKHQLQLKSIYIVTAVPTVIINTQVRLFILRTNLSWSVNSFLLLGLVEPVLRISKTWLVAREIRRHEALGPLSGKEAPSRERSMHQNRVSSIRSAETRVSSRLDWKQSLLHFHAAEIHADMCSEYISIACSISIYYLFRTHPKFGWQTSTSKPGGWGDVEQAFVMAFYQVAIELVVDFFCCMWEIAHGIPLHAADRLGWFLSALFTGCAIASISMTALLYAHVA